MTDSSTPQTNPKDFFLPRKMAALIVALAIFACISLVILYYTFTPVQGGSMDLELPYSMLTHTISKLGRLENQPHGHWILWCLAMMACGVSILILLTHFYKLMVYTRSDAKISAPEKWLRRAAWISLFIGAIAVIVVGFLPLSSSNGVYTTYPHLVIVFFMAFLIFGWLLLLIPLRQFIRQLQRSFTIFFLQYIIGLVVLVLTIYWAIVVPDGALVHDDTYLIWGFWSYVLAEWLALVLIFFFSILLFRILRSEKKLILGCLE